MANHADSERADQFSSNVSRLYAECIDGRKQRTRRLDELFASRGQAKSAAAAFAQAVAQTGFERR